MITLFPKPDNFVVVDGYGVDEAEWSGLRKRGLGSFIRSYLKSSTAAWCAVYCFFRFSIALWTRRDLGLWGVMACGSFVVCVLVAIWLWRKMQKKWPEKAEA